MIKLTPSEEKTLEGIKEGMVGPKIAEKYEVATETIRGHIRNLTRKKIIRYSGKQGFFYTYEYTGIPYEVEKANHTPKIKHTFDPGEDKFLANAVNPQLTEDQLLYLQQHRKNKRSILAKKLGLTKLQLNFALDKLG